MLPLMFASGAGANGNSSLGTGVVGGMLIGTLALLFITPVFFIVFQYLQEKVRPPMHKEGNIQIMQNAKRVWKNVVHLIAKKIKMKKIIMTMTTAALLSSCGLYKSYERPADIQTDGLYRSDNTQSGDSLGLASIRMERNLHGSPTADPD